MRAGRLRFDDGELVLDERVRRSLADLFDRLVQGMSVVMVSDEEMHSTQGAAELLP